MRITLVIQWLHKKIEDNERIEYTKNNSKANLQSATSSTPYIPMKTMENNLQDSDCSINFYATSKLSSLEESPQLPVQNKKGLDPKYLNPAPEDKFLSEKGSSRPATKNTLSKKGKENKCIELPKVNYREKKSSRPTTYRATPVSAYFP